MNRFETNLRIPGPTSLPSAVREAGARQMINHRGPEFAAMLGRIQAGLQPFFGTANEVLLLTAAGTGGLEAAVVNTLSPGDRVLAVSIGAFGERFAKIASTFGAEVTKLDVEWGRAADPGAVAAALRDAPAGGYRAVLVTHNETSTGVMNPLAEIAAAVRANAPDALILVDGVSGLGAVPFEQDRWGVDVVVSGSQKAWMVAPGMAFASLGERAWAAAETARMPRFYLDLRAHRKSAANGETPWTPAVGIVFQLDVAIGLMAAEGPEAIFARHAACAAATQAGLEALGFELLAEAGHRSHTVTAAWIPDGIDWKAFNADLKRRKLVVAGGQGQLAGRIMRVGHLGTVTLDEILGAIGVLEEVSLVHRRDVVPGSAVAAAQRAGLEALGVAGGVAAGA
ncbi:MAG TPA: alanine--glyoxylate aminotransferase family protein [Candidatus Limnocylindrales bacterium]|nr:alanine--glyoxylate aminotransferase family protein [Candidatus Limnocylindrales bacterium]